MGKTQSKNIGLSTLGFMPSTKKRENPEGGYVLSGCVNSQFRESDESLWHSRVALLESSDSSEKRTIHLNPVQQPTEDSHTCQCKGARIPVGFAQDSCQFEVALPPEVTGSSCSLKVVASAVDKMENTENQPPLTPTMSAANNSSKATVGAVDCDVSLDGESDQQEWAFTLYDFDGHRKVTREDLSSLLKTISEALASTITLPASGSRKLRLRLSVGSSDTGEQKHFTPDCNTENKENTALPTVDAGRGGPAEDCEGGSSPTVHKQARRENAAKTHRQQRRTMSASQADCNGVDGRSPDVKRQHRIRKHQNTCNYGGSDEVGHKLHSYGGLPSPTREPENLERRNYYEELAGIENDCNHEHNNKFVQAREREVEYLAQQQMSLPNRTRHTSAERLRTRGHRHSKGGKGGHRRSRSYDLQAQGVPQQEGILSNEEHKLKCGLKHRYHKDYHMLLLEASRAKLEGYQPAPGVYQPVPGPYQPAPGAYQPASGAYQPASGAPPNPTSPGPVRPPGFPISPSPLTRLATFTPTAQTNYPTPCMPPSDPVVGSPKVPSRRRSHKKLRKPVLQPFTYMQHEIATGMEGMIYVPISQRHDHHHHHEHHHHHHYHHYNK